MQAFISVTSLITYIFEYLQAIVIDLGITSTQGFWIGTSYLLANAATMPMIAAVSDVFGRTLLLMASLIVFSTGTIMCCITREIGVMLAGRSLQGIGGGGIIVLALVIFTDIVPLRFRPKWYGMVYVSAGSDDPASEWHPLFFWNTMVQITDMPCRLGAWALGTCTVSPFRCHTPAIAARLDGC